MTTTRDLAVAFLTALLCWSLNRQVQEKSSVTRVTELEVASADGGSAVRISAQNGVLHVCTGNGTDQADLAFGKLADGRCGARISASSGSEVAFLGEKAGHTGPILDLSDHNGNGRVACSVRADGPTMVLFGKNGVVRAGLGTQADGSVALALHDSAEHAGCVLGVTVANNSSLTLLGKDGVQPRVQFTNEEGGTHALALFDESNKPAILMGFDESALPSLRLMRSGALDIALSVDKQGSALNFIAPKNVKVGGMVRLEDGLHLALAGQDGRILFQAPER